MHQLDGVGERDHQVPLAATYQNPGNALGLAPLDPPPFAWLDGAVSPGALYIALLILTTQRRQEQLAQHREQLTLELTILSAEPAAPSRSDVKKPIGSRGHV